jgi:hypothetical protein
MESPEKMSAGLRMLKSVLAAIALVAVTVGSAGAQERAAHGSLVIVATTPVEDSGLFDQSKAIRACSTPMRSCWSASRSVRTSMFRPRWRSSTG